MKVKFNFFYPPQLWRESCPRPNPWKQLHKRPPRKLAMRVMLGTLGVSLALGLAGKSKAHVLTGLVFSGLLADHIWKRRKAL